MRLEPLTLTARWIFPVDQPPLAGGTITIHKDRILAVDKAGTRSADINLGNAAMLPGFVNAHTHLDLTDALGQCSPTADFTAWLRAVIAHRRRQTPEDVAQAVDVGLAQCLRYGTTLVGDISAGGASWERLAGAPLRAVVFYELIGLTRERSRHSLQQADHWIRAHPDLPSCRAGLSPHAPYSAAASLIRGVSELAKELRGKTRSSPVAIHMAETEAELLLLARQEGPLVTFLQELNAWDAQELVPDLHFILACFDKQNDSPLLLVHANYLKSLAAPRNRLNTAIVYCPRTHHAFGHAPHPFQAFQNDGTSVALGTDSLASNPDLDVLAEARFVHQTVPDVPTDILLGMATLTGAKVLGWDDITGSLTPGKSADLVILPLPDAEPTDPYSLVLDSSLSVREVIFRGVSTYATDQSVAEMGA